MNTITKICTKCKHEKPLEDFHKSPLHKYGVRSICKYCLNKQNNDYRKTHLKEEKTQKLIYRENNKEAIKRKSHEYWEKNKESLKTQNRIYNKNNKDAIRIQRLKYMKQYRNDNPHEKIASAGRNRINSALKSQNARKANRSQDLIGCSFKYLKWYIEAQFQEGMTWENHGLYGWHIDHIRPCSSFDLTDPEQQKQCFHYTNLQPLWAEENLKKSDKYEVNRLESLP